MARRVVTHQRSQRQFIWSDVLTHLAAVAFTVKIAAGASSTGLETGGGLTLIRTRGMYSFHFDPTSIADVVQWGLGLGVFTSDAFTIGVTAMPGPLTDADYDWIYYKTGVFGPASSGTESEDSLTQNTGYLEVDSKAMRKLKPNQTLGWVAEGIVLSGGGTLDMNVSARHLFKLG